MHIWISGLARAGGVEVAPDQVMQALSGPSAPEAPKPERLRPPVSALFGGLRDRFAPAIRGTLADATGGRPPGALETQVQDLFRALRLWRKRRTAVRELSALNDRILKDIGLDRSQISSVVEDLLTAKGSRDAQWTDQRTRDRQPATVIALGAHLREQCC